MASEEFEVQCWDEISQDIFAIKIRRKDRSQGKYGIIFRFTSEVMDELLSRIPEGAEYPQGYMNIDTVARQRHLNIPAEISTADGPPAPPKGPKLPGMKQG